MPRMPARVSRQFTCDSISISNPNTAHTKSTPQTTGICQLCSSVISIRVVLVPLTMNTSEGLDNHSAATKMTWLQSGMFSTATLTIVLITNDNPVLALSLCEQGGQQWSQKCSLNWVQPLCKRTLSSHGHTTITANTVEPPCPKHLQIMRYQ